VTARIGSTLRGSAAATLLLIGIPLAVAQAQDATWLSSPGTSGFNTGTNWSGGSVPTGIASFGTSNTAGISTSTSTTLGGFTYNVGASAYTISLGSDLTFTGAGIVNNSSGTQTITVGSQTITFNNSATAGSSSVSLNASGGGQINFNDSSSAGGSHIAVDGSGTSLTFEDNSTAGSSTVTVSNSAFMCFCSNATAGSAAITLSGSGSQLQFNSGTSAGTSTITSGTGTEVQFFGGASGGTARYIGTGGQLELMGSASSLSLGSIEGSGTISLADNTLSVGANNRTTTFSGNITGTNGGLTKTGTGMLTLASGGNYSFTGLTTVQQGTLELNGRLAGSVTVNAGATLGGSGTVGGNLVNSGTLASFGFNTFTVSGNFTQTSGGVYQVQVDSAGVNKFMNVTGNANLAGSVQVVASSGSYAANTRYTILNVTGTISGTFSGVTSNFAFLTPSLIHNAHSVVLNLALAKDAFERGAQNPNQKAVGSVLDRAFGSATGDFATVLNAIAVLDTVQGPQVLDAIGGQNYAGFSTASVQSATMFMNAFASQIGGSNGDNNRRLAMLAGADEACDIVCDVDLPRWGVWGGGIGGAGTVAGDAGSHGTNYNFGGFAGGLDYRFDPAFMAGAAVGYTATNLYTQGMDGTGHSGTVQLALYGQFTAGQIYLDGLAGYARGTNQMQRPIVITGLQPRTASSQTTVDQFFGQFETGYKIELGGAAQVFVTPFARLQGSTAMQAAFSETGADSLNLNVAAQTTNSLRTVLGTQLGGTLGRAVAKLRLGWSHELADTSRPVTGASPAHRRCPSRRQGPPRRVTAWSSASRPKRPSARRRASMPVTTAIWPAAIPATSSRRASATSGEFTSHDRYLIPRRHS
jgi:fibronectin-binding autotransporter adhesin